MLKEDLDGIVTLILTFELSIIGILLLIEGLILIVNCAGSF
jgi:hypothetical protein